MKIVWLSSRVLDNDLCSTTQIQLANGLVAKGHAVDLYSPGNSVGNAFSHHSIKRSKRRGFQASSVVKNLGNRIDEINLADVVLIDWPIFAIAKKIKPPVILMIEVRQQIVVFWQCFSGSHGIRHGQMR